MEFLKVKYKQDGIETKKFFWPYHYPSDHQKWIQGVKGACSFPPPPSPIPPFFIQHFTYALKNLNTLIKQSLTVIEAIVMST